MRANSALQVRINENKHILCQIVRAIIYLGKQGLPIRGDTEELNLCKNPGNFLALLKNYAETDEILHQHLNNPRAKNATYISPKSQNAFINVIGYDMILADIIGEIKMQIFSLFWRMKSLVIMLSIYLFVFTLLTRNAIFMKNLFHLWN